MTMPSVRLGQGSYSHGSVDIEAALVLDVEHQVSAIQVLHYKEQTFLENTEGKKKISSSYNSF